MEGKSSARLVVAPWETLNDSALNLSCKVTAEDDAAEASDMQAPWLKPSDGEPGSSSRVREAVEARQKRRTENAERTKAVNSRTKQSIDEFLQRNQAFRKQRNQEKEQNSKELREGRINEIQAKHEKKVALENAKFDKVDREKAATEQKEALENKKKFLAERRSELKEERERRVQKDIEIAKRAAQMRKERRLQQEEYKKCVTTQIGENARARAGKIRKERMEKEKQEAETRFAHQERQLGIRAAWMMEQKEEEKFVREQAIRERAEAIKKRQSQLREERLAHEEAQRNVQSKYLDAQRKTSEFKAKQKNALEVEKERKRHDMERQLEARHMSALERKRNARKEFKERSVDPLVRRSEFGAARRQEEALQRKGHEKHFENELSARKERKAAMRKAERELARQPFVFG